MPYDVFISYSRADYWDENRCVIPGNIVQQILDVLNAYKARYNINYFFDRERIISADNFYDRIPAAISDSRAVMFIASKSSVVSDMCRRELEYTCGEHITIHQYKIDDAVYPRNIQFLLGGQHFQESRYVSVENFVREVLSNVLHREIAPLASFANTNSIPSRGEKLYSIGDYYDDGQKQGVVFDVWDGGRHGKIVSLDQANRAYSWASKADYGHWPIVRIPAKMKIGVEDEKNGMHNMRRVMEEDNWEEKYPAFNWCSREGDDWYLPAIDELITLLLNNDVRNRVNNTLREHRAKELLNSRGFGWYWSSTEYKASSNDEDVEDGIKAWIVSMTNACPRGYDKSQGYGTVRAIAAF